MLVNNTILVFKEHQDTFSQQNIMCSECFGFFLLIPSLPGRLCHSHWSKSNCTMARIQVENHRGRTTGGMSDKLKNMVNSGRFINTHWNKSVFNQSEVFCTATTPTFLKTFLIKVPVVKKNSFSFCSLTYQLIALHTTTKLSNEDYFLWLLYLVFNDTFRWLAFLNVPYNPCVVQWVIL